jgi:adenine-specific DNA-methyltransferase
MAYRYIGNKARLVDFLLGVVGRYVEPGAHVADLMSGTASFSFGLRKAGYRVTAVDMMTYAYFHAIVRLRLDTAPAFRGLELGGYQGALDHLNSLQGGDGLIVREYSPAGAPRGGHPPRRYFTASNAARLDALGGQINEWQAVGLLDETELALLRHDLVLAANRVANIVGTYGHYWSRWNGASQQPVRLRLTEFADWPTSHTVLQGRAEDLAPRISCDLCYMDPPYTKRQYAANYHLIETIARGDEPEAVGLSGLRPWRDQYSDFCSKLRIRNAMDSILSNLESPLVLISYSEDGLLSRDQMMEFLTTYGAVDCLQFAFPRFRSNQSPLARELHEYVFVLDRAGEPGETRVTALPGISKTDAQQALFAH